MNSTGNYKRGISPKDIMSIPEVDKHIESKKSSQKDVEKVIEKYNDIKNWSHNKEKTQKLARSGR